MAVKAQFIAGQWLPGSGATMSKLAPEDQSLLWQAASAGADDVQAACAAARAAFYPWSHRPLAERIDVVQRFAALLETHKEALATLISRETSKPLWETRTEVQAMIGKAAISIEAYHQRTGFHESTLPDGKALLRHKPHGVMAVFGPYNFPGHLPNGHIIPALIAGNTIVFKPSELTPATAEMTVQLWQQAGIPDGAINLLQGGKATGQALLVALISILVYVGFRFEWRLAAGVVIALAHDVVITMGILSLFHIEIDLTIVASLMSVIGYSLNDSIVVSDRIRENFRKIRRGTPYEIFNVSLTQTLHRTLITSGTTLMVILMLFLFGGPILEGFSLTMLIGVSIGTASSIYVASALALKLGMKREHLIQQKVEKEGADQPSILP